MDWTAGILGGLMGGSQAAQTILQEQRTHAQKMQDMQMQEQLYQQRQRFVENLRAPTEKTVMSNDDKGHAVKITQQWVPPPDDNTPGHYQEVGREVVPTKYAKDRISVGRNQEQDILYDPQNPSDRQTLGAPRDIFDPETARYHNAELGLSAGRLAEEQRYHNQEHDDKVSGVGTRQSTVPHDLDLPGNVKVQGNIVPGRGFVPMQTTDGTFAARAGKPGTDAEGNPVPPAPTDFDSINQYFSPPSNFPGSFQLDQASHDAVTNKYGNTPGLKQTPMSQLSGSAIDAGGSGAQQTPRPAQPSTAATGPGGAGPTPQASAQGKGTPKLQVNRSTGQKRYVYPDGTIVPVGQ